MFIDIILLFYGWGGRLYFGGLGGWEGGIVVRGDEIIGMCWVLMEVMKLGEGIVGVVGGNVFVSWFGSWWLLGNECEWIRGGVCSLLFKNLVVKLELGGIVLLIVCIVVDCLDLVVFWLIGRDGRRLEGWIVICKLFSWEGIVVDVMDIWYWGGVEVILVCIVGDGR